MKTKQTRIRGPNLAVLIPRNSGVPFEEGLARANAENRIIASNRRLDKALDTRKETDSIACALPCWSGTMTAYVEPDQPLGKKVICIDKDSGYRWIFPVPQEHQDKTNAILVSEHPDYLIQHEGKDRIVIAKNVDLIEGFPANEGWYYVDYKHYIPNKYDISTIDEGGICRTNAYLLRKDRRIGPIVRDYKYLDWKTKKLFFYERTDHIYFIFPPSWNLGIVMETSKKPQKPKDEGELY